MLKMIPDLPGNVVGVEAVGKVEAADYRQVLDPAVAHAIMEHGKVRLLYVLGAGYEGYTAAAAWEDTKLGFHDFSAWERLAVVTDHDLLADAVRVVGWLIPGDVRTYPTSRFDEAKTWVSEEGADS